MSHETLRVQLHGDLILPEDATYDELRVVWNGMINRRPALIVRPRNAADVASAVRYARNSGLAIAIRSGGHNVAGYAVCEGGMMIDLSRMAAVRAGRLDLRAGLRRPRLQPVPLPGRRPVDDLAGGRGTGVTAIRVRRGGCRDSAHHRVHGAVVPRVLGQGSRTHLWQLGSR